jgi:hypothetical protein
MIWTMIKMGASTAPGQDPDQIVIRAIGRERVRRR